MKATIQYIKQELKGLYHEREILGFIRLILEQVCGLNYSQQIIMRDRILVDSQRNEIRKMVERLKSYEPVQYILGETEFMGIRLLVNKSVLIPRPETEELVQWIVESGLPSSPKILDAGTGSGCIALGLKKHIPSAVVHAFDISDQALETAKRNAHENNLDVLFYKADILNWQDEAGDRYDVIVSNPPYVRELEKKKMEANVLMYEPEDALFVPDNDPLKFYSQIAAIAIKNLNPGGWLFFEINENLGYEMNGLMEQLNFLKIEIRKDLSGKDRMLRCRKQ